MTTSEQITEILKAAKSSFVNVTFAKANGEVRSLTTNPKQIGEVLGTGTACKDPDVFRIVDTKLGQWRSFDARRCHSIKVGGKLTQLNTEA